MQGILLPNLLLTALLAWTGMALTPEGEAPARFLERIRVLGVEQARGEVTIVDPEGKSRTWNEGDRIDEEAAVLKKVTRSTLVLIRTVEGAGGEKGESLVVVRFDSSGNVSVREYSSVSDALRPVTPPPDSIK
jgi:hypothetical protein